MIKFSSSSKRTTPGRKLAMTILLGLLLSIPLFATYLLVYDRESQSQVARTSIVEGWGGPQRIAGPFLVIPFSRVVTRDAVESGRTVRRTDREDKLLFVAPTRSAIRTRIDAERRHRSIYEAVVYRSRVQIAGQFRLPDFAALNIPPDSLRLADAEIRVGIGNAKGLAGSRPAIRVDGRTLPLIPGASLATTSGSGFTGRGPIAAGVGVANAALLFDVAFDLRGSDELSFLPSAEQTSIDALSAWPHPSFTGAFLPNRTPGASAFPANWQIGNLALNRPVVTIGEQEMGADEAVTIGLLDPINLYSQVNRATKYGFMFIGFTFLALLMFDIIGGAPVPGVAYLLIGAGLVLFFILLLALAEVIGFLGAYLVASLAIVALISSYSAAILQSWRRAGVVAALLAGLYAVLYVLLSLEAYSLLIGSGMLFAALAGVMYATRRIDWGGVAASDEEDAALG
ncbi:inner membrane protein [Sphingomonas sp. PP-CE-3A-406]|uniref:cell envelope integrity protein CreD n=1 Tax=Sphingomonas sp. PP-CE-3A-406 TaxID=2135659 RepID=UPI000EF891FE|nr:cell envelope integrity protein CreD [Sphingomonas sp. PP-CE-3A-406]RMB55557.1 inner membrane protein [Sphingomonas sp. PP-CE-3A-406]